MAMGNVEGGQRTDRSHEKEKRICEWRRREQRRPTTGLAGGGEEKGKRRSGDGGLKRRRAGAMEQTMEKFGAFFLLVTARNGVGERQGWEEK
jgi:hypothetical protein